MTLDVRTMCLGALSEAKASGYELQKTFKEGQVAHFLEASYGSIYPALTRLTEEGLVTYSEQTQEGRPDKKVYSITPAGRKALEVALQAKPAEDRFRSEFLFFMSFSDLMETDQVTRLIDDRIETLRNKQALLDEADQENLTAGKEFVLGYGRAMLKASLEYLQNNRSLLKTPKPDRILIEKINSATSPSPTQN